MGAWNIGEQHVARVLRNGKGEGRTVAAGFYHALAVFRAKAGKRDAAERAITCAVDAWPDIRTPAMRS
jgi:hypothetical protein